MIGSRGFSRCKAKEHAHDHADCFHNEQVSGQDMPCAKCCVLDGRNKQCYFKPIWGADSGWQIPLGLILLGLAFGAWATEKPASVLEFSSAGLNAAVNGSANVSNITAALISEGWNVSCSKFKTTKEMKWKVDDCRENLGPYWREFYYNSPVFLHIVPGAGESQAKVYSLEYSVPRLLYSFPEDTERFCRENFKGEVYYDVTNCVEESLTRPT